VITEAAEASLLRGATVDVRDLIALRRVRLPRRERAQSEPGAPGGSRLTRLRGRGIDFAEVRLYQPGDDVRAIDWRVTARKAKPHTKVFREERERPTVVVVDQQRSMFFGSIMRLKSVAAAEAAAILAWHAVDGGDRVGGLVIDDDRDWVIRPRRNPRTVVRLLGHLAQSNRRLYEAGVQGAPTPQRAGMRSALDHLLRLARNGFRIYLVSDFSKFDDDIRRRIERLARHNSLVLVRVTDPLDEELPPPASYQVTDGVQRYDMDTSAADRRRQYRARFDNQTAAIEGACRRARSALITLSTREPTALRLAARLLH
jgi:uncharacterized protein (DUF58 family)